MSYVKNNTMSSTGKITLDEARLYLRDTTTEDEVMGKMIGMAEVIIEGLTGIAISNLHTQPRMAALAMLAVIHESRVNIDAVYGLINT